MKPRFCILITLGALMLAAMLAGCAVGPDFVSPDPPKTQSYEASGMPTGKMGGEVVGEAGQVLVSGEDIPAAWWTLFHSEALNDLITLALNANPDLEAAEAALREAKENQAAASGVFVPDVALGAGVNRQKISGAAFGNSSSIPPFSLYNATANLSYTLDVFGGSRRAYEAQGAQTDYVRFQREAAYIALTSNVVEAAIQEASLRAQIAATKEIIDAENQQLHLLNKQVSLGATAKTASLAQAATLAQTQASLPPLEKQLGQSRHLLSVLAGQFPSDDVAGKFDLANLHLPENLPLTLPSKLVEQRPDVKAAEARLHAASAEMGVATANMLPQFSISGDIGSEAATLASLFGAGSAIWNIGANVTQPLLHEGVLLHQRRAAQAAYDVAAAQYCSTVLSAFQNVADTLRALTSDADAVKAQRAAEQAAKDSLDLARDQFQAGATSYLSLLPAEQTYQQTKVARVQAEAMRYADTAALFYALGGGWWNAHAANGDVPKSVEQKEIVPNQTTHDGEKI